MNTLEIVIALALSAVLGFSIVAIAATFIMRRVKANRRLARTALNDKSRG